MTDWMADAYCAPLLRQGLDPFNPLLQDEFATKVCSQCPVQVECDGWAGQADPDKVGLWGTWGGVSYLKRAELFQVKPRGCDDCGEPSLAGGKWCQPCFTSRFAPMSPGDVDRSYRRAGWRARQRERRAS